MGEMWKGKQNRPDSGRFGPLSGRKRAAGGPGRWKDSGSQVRLTPQEGEGGHGPGQLQAEAHLGPADLVQRLVLLVPQDLRGEGDGAHIGAHQLQLQSHLDLQK